MQAVYVPVTREMKERLAEIARRERRDPREQAAVLLERALHEHRAQPSTTATSKRTLDGAQEGA